MLWGPLDPKLRRPGHRPQRLEGEVCLASGFGAMGPSCGRSGGAAVAGQAGFLPGGSGDEGGNGRRLRVGPDPRGCHRPGHQAVCGHLPGSAEIGSPRAPVAMNRAWAGPDNVPAEEAAGVSLNAAFLESHGGARRPSRKCAAGTLTRLDTAKDTPKNGARTAATPSLSGSGRAANGLRAHRAQSTATSKAAQISRMRTSPSRPIRSTRTATATLSTESRLTAERLGTGSSPGSSSTSLGNPRTVVVHGATSARLKRGMAASRERTTTGRRPMSANSHHHTSPRAGRLVTS
jgi:hypothetical protein